MAGVIYHKTIRRYIFIQRSSEVIYLKNKTVSYMTYLKIYNIFKKF